MALLFLMGLVPGLMTRPLRMAGVIRMFPLPLPGYRKTMRRIWSFLDPLSRQHLFWAGRTANPRGVVTLRMVRVETFVVPTTQCALITLEGAASV